MRAFVPRWISWIAGALGVALLGMLVRQLGAREIVAHVAAPFWLVPVVLIVSGARYPLQTIGWRLVLPGDSRPPLWRSIAATLAGNAASYMTVAGPVAGEPVRALLIREHVPTATGVAAGAFERAVYGATGALVTLAAIPLGAYRIGRPSIAMAAVGIAAILCAAWLRRIGRLRADGSGSATSRQDDWRTLVASLWRSRLTTLAIAGLALAQHLLLIVESWLILRALGVTSAFETALVFEGLSKLVNSVATFVPAGVGIAEGGGAVIGQVVAIGANAGLSVALTRRVRATVWSAVGVAALLAYGWAGNRPFARSEARDPRIWGALGPTFHLR